MGRIHTFLRDENGSHTLEFVIWVPLFLFFLAAVIDGSVIYLTRTEMWNVARDTARRMTTGELANTDDAKMHAWNELHLGERQYYIDADDSGGEATVTIRTYIWDASVFGIFGLLDLGADGWEARTLDATVTMQMEPNVS